MPPLLRATADDAVRDAVRRAGPDADVLAHARWEHDDGPTGGRVRDPRLAEDVDDFRGRAEAALDPDLRAVLRPPVATVTSPSLKVTDGSVLRTSSSLPRRRRRCGPTGHLDRRRRRPAPNPGRRRTSTSRYNGPPWTVQIGLSEADAAALGVGPGDRIPLGTSSARGNVRVSGVFRAADAADPAWRLAPWLLHPVAGTDGAGTTRLAGLLSPDSLPDARLAFAATS